MSEAHERDDQLPLNEDDLREMFLELAELLPSERLTAEDRAAIRKLTAEADRQAEATRSDEIHDLNKMLDRAKDIR